MVQFAVVRTWAKTLLSFFCPDFISLFVSSQKNKRTCECDTKAHSMKLVQLVNLKFVTRYECFRKNVLQYLVGSKNIELHPFFVLLNLSSSRVKCAAQKTTNCNEICLKHYVFVRRKGKFEWTQYYKKLNNFYKFNGVHWIGSVKSLTAFFPTPFWSNVNYEKQDHLKYSTPSLNNVSLSGINTSIQLWNLRVKF